MKRNKTAFDLIAFDADDTLWDTESLYRGIEARFKTMMASYGIASVDPTMHDNEIRNLQYYGYGLKGFILSLIETAIELTGGRLGGNDVSQMLAWAKEMQTAPIRLREHAQTTVAALSASYPLLLITKGDLLDQEAKLTRSGLSPYFRDIEVVSEKTQHTYAAILARHRVEPSRFLMVGNSLKSDILPVVTLGGHAVYIPAHLLWEHEAVSPPTEGREQQYVEMEHLGLLVPWIASLTEGDRDHA